MRYLIETDLFAVLDKNLPEDLSVPVVNHARRLDRVQLRQIELRRFLLVSPDKIDPEPGRSCPNNKQKQNRYKKYRASEKRWASYRFSHIHSKPKPLSRPDPRIKWKV